MRYGRQVVDQTVFRSAMIMITTFLSFLALFTIILGAMGLDFIQHYQVRRALWPMLVLVLEK